MTRKVLIFIDSLALGGAETSLITLLNSINIDELSIDLLMLGRGPLLPHVPRNVSVKIIDGVKPTLYKKFKYYLLRLVNYKSHISQSFWECYKDDIVAVTEPYDLAIAWGQGFATYYVATKVDSKTKIAWINTDYVKAGFNAAADKVFYEKYDKIVAVSEAGKKSFDAAFHNTFADKTIVVEDLIDREKILWKAQEEVAEMQQDCLKIVTVGRLDPAKGYDLAIKAAEILRDKKINFKWWIVGEGGYRTRMESLILRKKLGGLVILVGADLNPYKYMKGADLYVQSSKYEGLSITVREAKILQKIIISTNFPSVNTALTHDFDGLISEMSGESIAANIIRVIESDELKKQILTNLRKSDNVMQNSAQVSILEKLLLQNNN